jgi:hypothetical protein
MAARRSMRLCMLPQNPLHRGTPPFEWPVNSFFFSDPVSGNWYIYVGDYRGFPGSTWGTPPSPSL